MPKTPQCEECDCADPTALDGLAAECDCRCHRPEPRIVAECWTCAMPVPRKRNVPGLGPAVALTDDEVEPCRAAGHDVREVSND